MSAPFRITFLGGLGEIGRNCAVLETAGKMLILDCGILFPDADSPGVDLVLPDFTYLRDNAKRVVGCIATHGHEDHVGALGFLLRDLSFPIYGSRLTLGLARNRIEEAGLTGRTEFVAVSDGERRQIGPFDVDFVPVTHSVPHGFATVVRTPPRCRVALGGPQAGPEPDRRSTHRPVPHRGHRQERGHPTVPGRLHQR
jgi:ribonuclease J